jgi:hypothetical protein
MRDVSHAFYGYGTVQNSEMKRLWRDIEVMRQEYLRTS